MSLNDIQLPAALIQELYEHSLVEMQPAPAKSIRPAKQTEKAWAFLGKNQKGICLLVDYANDVYLPDADLQFLTNILQACKLNLGDVAILNFHKHKASFSSIAKE